MSSRPCQMQSNKEMEFHLSFHSIPSYQMDPLIVKKNEILYILLRKRRPKGQISLELK